MEVINKNIMENKLLSEISVKANLTMAIFMGGEISKCRSYIWLPPHGIKNVKSVKSRPDRMLKYHESWDWLIPVLDKIYSSSEYVEYCAILKQPEQIAYVNTKFILVNYEFALAYIKWYNNSKTL